MPKNKRRLPPEERGGSIAWENEQHLAYGFPGQPRSFEVWQKNPSKLIFRYDNEYGIFLKCRRCHTVHVLLWRDYFQYFHDQQQAGKSASYYKVLCDGGPRLRLAQSDEYIEGRFTCIEHIEGDLTNETFFTG